MSDKPDDLHARECACALCVETDAQEQFEDWYRDASADIDWISRYRLARAAYFAGKESTRGKV